MVIFVPVPTHKFRDTLPVIAGMLAALAGDMDAQPDDLAIEIDEGRILLVVLWDEAALKVAGICLVSVEIDFSGKRVCHLRATRGEARENWQHLIHDLEKWAKEHLDCEAIRATCRPGWKPFLSSNGYNQAHVVMEKTL